MSTTIEASVVVLAYGAETSLIRCIDAIIASKGIRLELIVVDNGADPGVMKHIRERPGVSVIGPAKNRGFTGGCNEGARRAVGQVIVLVNSDAFVESHAIRRLVDVALGAEVGIASASLRLDDEPDHLNSAGNPVHFSGLTWSGAFGEPANDHDVPADIASATGAAMAMRRVVWERFGGFDEIMFAYLEDTELSLRCWQAGLAVRFVPDAVVRHAYEFARHDTKLYLLERNRLLLLMTLFRGRSLLVLAPALAIVELAMLVQSIAGGWFPAKLRGWIWLARNIHHVRARRRLIAATRVVPDGAWMQHLSGRIEPANVATPPGMALLNAVLGGYWRIARRLLSP